MMFSRSYIIIPYLRPLLIILLFVCSPTYLSFNIADHQMCGLEINQMTFWRIIVINDRFKVHSTISYYNVKHIKDNIYGVEAKGNYFRLVTLETVHPNDKEFCSYDITTTLVKQYVLAGYHSFVKFGQHKIVF